MSQPPPLRINIRRAWRGRTIESVLRQEFSFSRRQIIALKKWNGIILNGVPVYAKTRLRGGEELLVRFPPPSPQKISPEKIDVEIIYEDPDLIVVNKPAGMLVHPVRFHRSGTLANALTYHWQKTGSAAAFHPVHSFGPTNLRFTFDRKKSLVPATTFFAVAERNNQPVVPGGHRRGSPLSHGLIAAPSKKRHGSQTVHRAGRPTRPDAFPDASALGPSRASPGQAHHRAHPSDPGSLCASGGPSMGRFPLRTARPGISPSGAPRVHP